MSENQTQNRVESAPTPSSRWEQLAEEFQQMMRSIMAQQSIAARVETGFSYEELSPEEKEAVDAFMEKAKPEIQEKAVQLLTNEIRDKIARTGNLKKLVKLVEKGKLPKLKRKRGCIFFQFGSGEPDDEIEEFLVAST